MLFNVLCLLAASGYVSAECSEGCNEPTLFYQTLGCKPIFAAPTACCPSKFDCSHIALLNEEKCHVNGNIYGIEEDINNEETEGNCKVGCTCTRKHSGNMGFTCATLDCPEWTAGVLRPGCDFKYELDKCCSVGTACEPFSASCDVDGQIYHEGQVFANPNDSCSKCVCQKGWQGKFEAPFCKKTKCIEEVVRHKEVYSFCAPSYITNEDCCPLNWVCPKNDDKISKYSGPNRSDLKCLFGKNTLNLGDKFVRTHGEIGKLSCECRIPPYLTCIQNDDYPTLAPED